MEITPKHLAAGPLTPPLVRFAAQARKGRGSILRMLCLVGVNPRSIIVAQNEASLDGWSGWAIRFSPADRKA